MEPMGEKLEKVTKTKKITDKITDFIHPFESLEGSRWVDYATFQAEIHWPKKAITEVSINHIRYPYLKLLDVPKHQRLYIIDSRDGSEFSTPSANIKGMVYL